MFGAESPLVLSRPAAVKTGTTNDLRDNWTVGYTRFLVAGVWTGNSDGHPMRGATGISGAAPIWHAFMEAVLADPALLAVLDAPADPSADPAAWQFPPPAGVQQIDQCPPSLACRAGGEYFTQSWLQQTGGEPLRDSVANGAFAGVYVETGGQRRQIGYCGGPALAAGPTQSLLMLPAGPAHAQAADAQPNCSKNRLRCWLGVATMPCRCTSAPARASTSASPPSSPVEARVTKGYL